MKVYYFMTTKLREHVLEQPNGSTMNFQILSVESMTSEDGEHFIGVRYGLPESEEQK